MNGVVRQLFDAFDRAVPHWSDALFEEVFQIASAASCYHDVKELILEAEALGAYSKAVEHYARELKKRHGDLPVELLGIGAKYKI